MSPFTFRDDDDSSYTNTVLGVLVGAVAGFAVGMVVAQRVGGFSGLRSKLRRGGSPSEQRIARAHSVADEDDEFEDIEEDELEPEGGEAADAGLEERVLEAFRNDPILAERAIDIGSISDGVIELAGWVDDDDEAQHAVTIARGVPGVDTVVNRIAIDDEERRAAEATRRFEEGDVVSEGRWEGQRVGTGRRRQGTSEDPDRHADPKVTLEDRWLREDTALRDAADDTIGSAERRRGGRKAVRGDRTGGSPISPTGVPKGDHVAEPVRDSGGAQTERTDLM